MTVTITLKKPLEIGEEKLTELTFSEPTMKEIRECGFPYTIDPATGVLSFDANSIARYVHKLCKVPPSTVDNLSPADAIQCQGVIMSFFGESAA